ncbi:MAG: Ribonuclease BN [Syntrophus sp. SKADARSKE-3]|nr:Ribonuclease BN [Syntrophus sp. SKADARSKE-3]
MSFDVTRRNTIKISALALGGLALGGSLTGCSSNSSPPPPTSYDPTKTNSLISGLEPYYPGTEALGANEMRITLVGTSPIPRLAQECESIFVEVGRGPDGPLDQFVFDCGSGVVAKYNVLGIQMRKMNKIFLTHLHGDHTSDLTHIYCFGPAEDRKSPLYIWGPSPSGLVDPINYYTYNDDGTKVFCQRFRDSMRWHTESFSFGVTSYASCPSPDQIQRDWGLKNLPAQVVPMTGPPDSNTDGYAIFPIELDWSKRGDIQDDNLAYNNAATGVKITHFPSIHCRQGSIAYKLEWTIPSSGGKTLTLIFSGDTKPSYDMIDQAKNGGAGVDVLIHEMVVPAEVWAAKNLGYATVAQAKTDPMWIPAYNYALAVQNSSHTPQGAFGYILSQITPKPPRLAVATHFQATDDTIASARTSIRNHYPTGDVTIAADLMVLNITPTTTKQRRAVVSEYAWYPVAHIYPDNNPAKYGTAIDQLDPARREVPAPTDTSGNPTYNTDGY